MNGFIDAEGKALATRRFMEQLPVRRLAINAELTVPLPWNPSAVQAPEWLNEAVPADLEPDQACTRDSEDCTTVCTAQDGGFVRDVVWNGMDAEGPCNCEHHEVNDVLATWKLQAVLA